MKTLTFAVDFDGTFAAAPETFHQLVALLKRHGHTVVIVTGRGAGARCEEEVNGIVRGCCPVVYAGESWKRHAAESAGYAVDVWIDDMPEWIGPQAYLLGT